MMSEYNRTNPFLYLLKEAEDELELVSSGIVRQLFYCLIVTGVYLLIEVSFIMVCYISMWHMLLNVIIIGSALFNAYHIKKTFYQNRHQEINQMVLSDKFKNIDLNNEKLLDSIIILKKASGFMNGLYENTTMTMLVHGCCITAIIVHFLLEIFK